MIRVAVAGLGFMGATHARAWTRIEGAELCAVVSSDERKWTGDLSGTGGNLGRETVRLDFARVRKYRELSEVLADREIDVIDVCFPTNHHADAAIAALRSGKHVLVEKPLALNEDDAERVVYEAERSGRVLMCAQVLRFMPAYVIARERLGSLGPVRSAAFRRRCSAPSWSKWLSDPARSGGGAFDLLIHDVDFARWVFGIAEEVEASGAFDAERGIDVVAAKLEYPGWAVTISGGWHGVNAYPFTMDFTIVCEGGVLEYCCGQLIQYRPQMGFEEIALPQVDPFESELAHFAQCVRNNRFSEICPPRESADAVRLMRHILRARNAGARQ